MSATTSAERLLFVDRLLSKPWLRGAVKSMDKLACYALDAIDASWEIVKDPVIEVVENTAFSSLGQFTIGCLESGVNITANVLDVVLPVGDKTKTPKGKGSKRVFSKPDIVDPKKKMVPRERKGGRLESIRTASATVVLSLRDLEGWLKSLKLENDICGHCSKRRKLIAPRRLGSYGILHWIVSITTFPFKIVTIFTWDDLKRTLPLSGNELINKNPVRPMSATEKRKFLELDSSDDEDIQHTFHDDLDDYKSDEDEDYKPQDKHDTTDSEEYRAGETESDVSLDEVSPVPLKAREAKKGIKLTNGNTNDANKKNDKGKKADDTKKGTDNKDKTSTPANKNAKKPGTPKSASGTSVDKQSGNLGAVNGQKSGGKDSGKSTDVKKGVIGPMMKPVSPLRMGVAM